MTSEIEHLHALARARGIEPVWHDIAGVRHEVAADSLLAVLAALGQPLAGPGDAAAARARLDAHAHDELAPRVLVAWDREPLVVPLRVPARSANRTVECGVRLEFGATLEWRRRVADLPVVEERGADGTPALRSFVAPEPLPFGVHTLRVVLGDRTRESIVIAAPRRGAAGDLRVHGPRWGVFQPLFALRGDADEPVGDLGDLAELAQLAGERGATVVATLPMLAAFLADPCEPSPYRPVSRRMWNELFVDLDQVPELRSSPEAAALLASPGYRREAAALAAAGTVDYARVAHHRRLVLEHLAHALASGPPQRLAAFRNFLADRPEVAQYARFRALGERLGTAWRDWPARMRNGIIGFNDVDPTVDHYHRFVQWLADGQMADLAAGLHRRGQALALDLPVGSHPDGFDVWASPASFAHGISIGAPPDEFAPGGQRWAVPAPHPDGAREDGYRDLRAALVHLLRHAGVLRIDHVMGLHRLWWVPDAADATAGAYVRYASEELWALVCLEASRHHAGIVGENLGTVPVEVDEAMARHGAHPMHVVRFALDPGAAAPVRPAPAGSVAMWGTHDMATFAGWWTTEATPDERDALWRDAGGTGEPPGPPPTAVLDAVHGHLAGSDADIVMVNLDDTWLEPEPVNVPGVVDDRNWCRRAMRTLGEIGRDEAVAARLAVLALLRPRHVPERAIAPSGSGESAPGTASTLTDLDLHLLREGRHHHLYRKLGSHLVTDRDGPTTAFAVWAPNAEEVSVIGDFNDWRPGTHRLAPVDDSGVWSGTVRGVGHGDRYKYAIRPRGGTGVLEKADPVAFRAEVPPRTASIVWDLTYEWRDTAWLGRRARVQRVDRPMSVYEVHLGSWRRVPEEGNRPLTYRELAPHLRDYVTRMGYTHVELMPVMEHPFYGSWGYQITGYFAATSRYGAPQDLMYLVDELHAHGIGVILDWVPSHFPDDPHGLAYFDGSHLYEHEDLRQRVHPDWGSLLFNYGRNEVRAFLVSSAMFWLDHFHADGLRMDAVASMLYLDYSRAPGDWVPNRFGGRENLEAIDFVQQCNEAIGLHHPDVITFAEESTAWPGVTQRTDTGGLGFWFKWDMGWMHDTLAYFHRDPVHRRFHHGELTFRSVYAQSEQYLLPLSHDEVVHGKGALLAQMPGDDWRRRAGLRLLLGYQWGLPGKQLLFMGSDLGAPDEWDHEHSVPWHLLDDAGHAGIARWVATLNRLHRDRGALHERDRDGFEWIDDTDAAASVLAWLRLGRGRTEPVIVAANFTPLPRPGHRIGAPAGGRWRVVANSDDEAFGGSGYPVPPVVAADADGRSGRPFGLELTLPPLGILFLVPDADGAGD